MVICLVTLYVDYIGLDYMVLAVYPDRYGGVDNLTEEQKGNRFILLAFE